MKKLENKVLKKYMTKEYNLYNNHIKEIACKSTFDFKRRIDNNIELNNVDEVKKFVLHSHNLYLEDFLYTINNSFNESNKQCIEILFHYLEFRGNTREIQIYARTLAKILYQACYFSSFIIINKILKHKDIISPENILDCISIAIGKNNYYMIKRLCFHNEKRTNIYSKYALQLCFKNNKKELCQKLFKNGVQFSSVQKRCMTAAITGDKTGEMMFYAKELGYKVNLKRKNNVIFDILEANTEKYNYTLVEKNICKLLDSFENISEQEVLELAIRATASNKLNLLKHLHVKYNLDLKKYQSELIEASNNLDYTKSPSTLFYLTSQGLNCIASYKILMKHYAYIDSGDGIKYLRNI